jgi:hypothetical protein
LAGSTALKFNNEVSILWNLQTKQSGQHQTDAQKWFFVLPVLFTLGSSLFSAGSSSFFIKICVGPKILVLSLCYFL